MPRLRDGCFVVIVPEVTTGIAVRVGTDTVEVRKDRPRELVTVPRGAVEPLPWKRPVNNNGYLHKVIVEPTALRGRLIRHYSFKRRPDGTVYGRECVYVELNGRPIPRKEWRPWWR